MAKRVAERQLTQLNQFDEDIDGDAQSASFRRADEDDLARRVIKKPKSRLRAQAQPIGDSTASNSDAEPKGVFKGFSFGQLAQGMSGAPAAAATPAKPAPAFAFGSAPTSGFVFGRKPADAPGDKPPAAPFKPATSFGFGGPKPTEAAEPAKPAAPVQTAPASGFAMSSFKPPAGQQAGLSFGQPKPAESADTAWLAAPVQTKPASGFSIPSFKAPAGDQAAPAFSQQPTGAFGGGAKPAAGFSMPSFKPPTGGQAVSSAFGGAKPASGFNSGFVPPAPAASAPMETDDASEEFYRSIRGLNVSLQSKIGDALKENAFVDLSPLLQQYRVHWDRIVGSRPPPVAEKPPATAAEPKAPAPAAVDVEKPAANNSTASKPLFAPTMPPTKPLFPSITASTMNTAPKPAFGAAAQPKPAFGAAAAPKPAGFTFGFGKPASTEESAKPFSFGLGKTAEAASAAPQQKPAFSFGFKPAEQQQQQHTDGDGDAGGDAASDADEAAAAPAVRSPTKKGEESESTVHQARVKLFRWDKDDRKYRDLGICNLRINTWEADGAPRARIVCRQETTEKITLNASIFAKMTVEYKPGEKCVGILVFMDGQTVQFRPRLKSAELARDLKAALDSAIASLSRAN